VLIRSWNVFHGNVSPPRRVGFLAEMVRRASGDGPDVLLLQEVPVWALGVLEGWSGMHVVGDIARRPRLPPGLARRITALDLGLFRSLFTGQANAILLAPEIAVVHHAVLEINPRRGIGTGAGERRICQVARLEVAGTHTVLLGHLHASNVGGAAPTQSARAAEHLLEVARPAEPVVLAGDFNAAPHLEHAGFTAPGPGIDHILVRGASASPLHVWPDERRRRDGMLLSDHAPVELEIR
jgi:endonuclease/exonuclease/phosphatase family metal-dependent hydrolase